jgi:hypothetical protein
MSGETETNMTVQVTIHPDQQFQHGLILEATAHIVNASDPDVCAAAIAQAAEYGIRQVRLECQPARVDLGDGVYDFDALNQNIAMICVPLDAALQAAGKGKLRINICNMPFGTDDNLTHTDADVYAAYVVATVQNVNAQFDESRIVSWEVANEPDNAHADSIYRPTGSGTLSQKTAIYQNNTIAARAALDAAGYEDVYLVGPSCVSAATALSWLNAFTADALKALGLFSYHRYSSASDPVIKDIGDFAMAHQTPTAMTEFDKASYGNLVSDLSLGQCSIWQRYGICGNDPGFTLAPWLWLQPDDTVTDNTNTGSCTRQARQVFAYVHPDAVRIGCTVSDTSKPPLAWQNPDGSVVVVRNAGGAFVLTGLTPGKTVTVTWAKLANAGNGGPTVVTVGSDGNALIPAPPGGGQPVTAVVSA